MHCASEPAHDLFGEQTNFDRPVIYDNVILYDDPSFFQRELHSDTLAAMLDINYRFDSHRG
jgi:hypothetical protein